MDGWWRLWTFLGQAFGGCQRCSMSQVLIPRIYLARALDDAGVLKYWVGTLSHCNKATAKGSFPVGVALGAQPRGKKGMLQFAPAHHGCAYDHGHGRSGYRSFH